MRKLKKEGKCFVSSCFVSVFKVLTYYMVYKYKKDMGNLNDNLWPL